MRKIVLAALALAGCGVDGEPRTEGQTTWYRDVGPIVARSCAGCHQAGGIAPFALTEYGEAVERAPQLLDAVVRGVMPPWDARETAECTPAHGWKDDPRLAPEEVETLRAWIADGTPAGEVAEIPGPPDTVLPGVTHTVAPTTPYVTSGLRDEFMCFVMKPALGSQIEWMTGLQVRPGNNAVVHHVVLSAMPPGPELDALVATTGLGKAFDCEAPMTEMPGSYFLGFWVPGMEPMQTSEAMSLPLGAGGAIIMQIHYHPAGRVNAPDTTSVDLRLTTTWPQKMYKILAFGNASSAPELLPGPGDRTGVEFRVPANVADHRERMRSERRDREARGAAQAIARRGGRRGRAAARVGGRACAARAAPVAARVRAGARAGGGGGGDRDLARGAGAGG